MTALLITRGLPASGKSTWAKAWVAEEPTKRARVNRDDLRAMLFDGAGILDHEQENAVSVAEQAQVEALLTAGISVVVDATHLRLRYARAWADLALKLGVEFECVDFDSDVELCIDRDAQRISSGVRGVGAEVIRDLAARFPQSQWKPVAPRVRKEGAPPAKCVADETLPPAYIVDVDGTVATMAGKRSPYDWHLVHLDEPIAATVEVVRQLSKHAAIVVMSGRDEQCREVTEKWLRDNGVPFDALFMRPARDTRKDSTIKAELFDAHVRDKYWVRGVFDDRLSVARRWFAMGLPLFRVGDPDADF